MKFPHFRCVISAPHPQGISIRINKASWFSFDDFQWGQQSKTNVNLFRADFDLLWGAQRLGRCRWASQKDVRKPLTRAGSRFKRPGGRLSSEAATSGNLVGSSPSKCEKFEAFCLSKVTLVMTLQISTFQFEVFQLFGIHRLRLRAKLNSHLSREIAKFPALFSPLSLWRFLQ